MQAANYDELAENIEQQLQTESPMIEWHVLRASEIIMRTTISFPDGFTHIVIEASIIINETQFRTESKHYIEVVQLPDFVGYLRHRTANSIAAFVT